MPWGHASLRGGHAWLGGGICGKEVCVCVGKWGFVAKGTCMANSDMHGEGGHVW